VTTEDDFQKALAAKPTDWQTRLVFADWLQERGDPRAEGYRALGALRLRPLRGAHSKRHWWTAVGEGPPTYNHLPPDWFRAVAGYGHRSAGRWRWPDEFDESRDNRREIEDAAARAFAALPAERRAALLAGEKPAAPAKKPKARAKKAKPRAKQAPVAKPKARARKPKARGREAVED
jgi:uncharacterized protein (TIGR02996 family)